MNRVALATCAALPDLDPDDQPLIGALAERGVSATPAVWDDFAVDWAAFDLVVLRSTWDYAERRDAFLTWANSLERVLNRVPVLEWSSDKARYLVDLRAADVPIVPTSFVAPGERLTPGDRPFVVKPSISTGGRMSARFGADEIDAAAALVERIHGDGRTAMMQPFVDGEEHSLVYVDGVYSHALSRRAPLPAGRERPGLYLDEQLAHATTTSAERAVADAAIACSPEPTLYGRVDLLAGAVLELELVEPSLYLGYSSGAVKRFADAIAEALS